MDSFKLAKQLGLEEADRHYVYDDATGKPLLPGMKLIGNATIGIGHNLNGKGISAAVCNELFHEDVADAMTYLATLWPEWSALDDVRQRVMVDLAFNLEHRLAGFVDFLSAMKAGNWNAAASALQDSLWYKQVGTRGSRLVHMILTGTDPADLS